MKRILIIGGVFLAFFLIGAAGMYYSMPTLFPDRAAPADSLSAPADSPALVPVEAEPELARALLDSVLHPQPDSAAAELDRVLPAALAILRDSLDAMRAANEALRVRHETALARIAELESSLEHAIVPDQDPADLAKTLAGMNERQLKPILDRISDNALMAVYHAASSRDKRTLIAAMSADRAVRLVQRQVAPGERPTASLEAKTDSASVPN